MLDALIWMGIVLLGFTTFLAISYGRAIWKASKAIRELTDQLKRSRGELPHDCFECKKKGDRG